jgi:hypothetical protein
MLVLFVMLVTLQGVPIKMRHLFYIIYITQELWSAFVQYRCSVNESFGALQIIKNNTTYLFGLAMDKPMSISGQVGMNVNEFALMN